MLEDLAVCRLSLDLSNERNGRRQVLLYYVPWYLVLQASVDRLQLVVCFSKVCDVLVDVFRAVYLARNFQRKLSVSFI